MKLRVAALILNWRDTPRTTECVRALCSSSDLESILVVDNESAPDSDLEASLSQLNDERIEVVTIAENRGFAGGINPGLHLLNDRGIDWILVINNDATFSPENLHILLSHAEAANAMTAFGPRILYPSGDVQASGSAINWKRASINHAAWPAELDYLTWACVLISAESLRTIGYLDESFFMYWEDADFGIRLQRAGGKLVVCEDAVAVHEENATKQIIGRLTMRYATASMATFARLHPRMSGGAHYRIVMRVLKQALTHGFSEIKPQIQAWKWGRRWATQPAWQRLPQAKWARPS